MKTLKLFTIALAGLLFVACAKPAADNKQAAASAGGSDRPPIASTDVVKVTPEELTLAKGQSGYANVRLQIQSGYHINANPPSFAYLKATELQLQPAGGISVDFITYPDPLTRNFSFNPDGPLKVYEGEAVVKPMLKATTAAEPGKHNLSATLRVQACDDQVCYAPGTIDLTIPVTVK